MQGLQWLISAGVTVELAGRRLSDETEHQLRHGFARILREHGIVIDAHDPRQLVLFPEMTDAGDPPEITPTCWEALNMSPSDIMCATGRMVVKRKGEEHPAVVACTLLPYDERFELGATLAEAHKSVHLAHRHCATFCVLGGAGCGQARESC
jgi:hypothetical protein